MQIVGKIRMAQTPPVNHWWHVTLYVSPRGLTTTEIPALPRAFEIEFDFVDHWLVIRCNDGNTRRMQLRPRSVADFYRELRGHLRDLAIDAPIYPRPNEVADAIPFDRDEQHASYDPEFVTRFWRILVSADRVFREFRSSFIGKCSPVHLFWGAPRSRRDTLLRAAGAAASGRHPEPPGFRARARRTRTKSAARGSGRAGAGSTTRRSIRTRTPSRPDSRRRRSRPSAAFYSNDLREYILPYDAVREAGGARRGAARVPAEHVRCGGGRRQLGSPGPRARAKLDRFFHFHAAAESGVSPRLRGGVPDAVTRRKPRQNRLCASATGFPARERRGPAPPRPGDVTNLQPASNGKRSTSTIL